MLLPTGSYERTVVSSLEHLTPARADFNQSVQRQPPTEGAAEKEPRGLFFVAFSNVSLTNVHTHPHLSSFKSLVQRLN